MADGLAASFTHLRKADPVLARVVQVNPAFDPLAWMSRWPRLDLFGALLLEIVSQQISVTEATAIFARLLGHFDGVVPDAAELASVDEDELREIGLSRQKSPYGA